MGVGVRNPLPMQASFMNSHVPVNCPVIHQYYAMSCCKVAITAHMFLFAGWY